MSKHTPNELQEYGVETTLAEHREGGSMGAVLGDDMGFGKTTQGAEIILRGIARFGWKRVLLIALPNTHGQWENRISLQADGQTPLPIRIMNGTKGGRDNFERFMKHEPGIFIAGSAFLQEKDWESRPELDDEGRRIQKTDKKTSLPEFVERPLGPYQGELVLVPRPEGEIGPAEVPRVEHRATRPGVIGPASEPAWKMKSVRKHVYDRFSRKPLDATIFDEVQLIANRKAKGRQTILSIKSAFRVAMSGTWFNNKVENQWSIARWVWPGTDAEGKPWVETNFSRWSERYLLREDVLGRGGRAIESPHGGTVKKVTGERIPGEFAASLPCYIRRENADRPPQPLTLKVDPLPAQRQQMTDLEADLMTWVAGWEGQEAPLVVDMPMTLRMRLRQVAIAELSLDVDPTTGEERVFFADDAQSAKLAPLRHLIEERWAGQPVGIFTDSKIGAHFVSGRLRRAGLKVGTWTGDLSMKEREELKAAFIAGQFDYLVGTIQSMGTGVDGLQTRCSKVVWISEADGNPSLNEQALARYFRQGRTHEHGAFEHVRLICTDSVDEIALENLIQGAWQMRAALNAGQVVA